MIGSLFSGIGGLELGLERAGLGPVAWQVEFDPFCRRILAKHWPSANRSVIDVKAANASNLPRVDLICGGFPCQDVSSAGKGAGLAVGTRSGLWFEFRRIVAELSPPVVVVENVASGKSRWLPQVRRDLYLLGYDTAAYAISAADVGAPHLRRRIFVVAHPFGESLRILAERVPWRRSGELRGTGQAISRNDGGGEGHVAHADGQRELRVSTTGLEGGHGALDGGDAGGGQWSVEPNVGRVAHGVPARMDRLKACGNAVVNQCAEVVGQIIREAAWPDPLSVLR